MSGITAVYTPERGLEQFIDDSGDSRFVVSGGQFVVNSQQAESFIKTTASITVSSERTVLADATSGGITITLPTAASRRGVRITVKKIDATENTITLTPAGDDLIDGSAEAQILVPLVALQLLSDGEAWWIL